MVAAMAGSDWRFLVVGAVGAAAALGLLLWWRSNATDDTPPNEANGGAVNSTAAVPSAAPSAAGPSTGVSPAVAVPSQPAAALTPQPAYDRAAAERWYQLGFELDRGGNLSIDGHSALDEEALFLRAIAADPTFAPAWNGLSSIVDEHSTCHVPDHGDLSPKDMAVRAATLDPSLHKPFVNLAKSCCAAPLEINGVLFETRIDLARHATKLAPNDADSWLTLAVLIANECCSAPSRCPDVTALSAAAKAWELGHPQAWKTLVSALTHTHSHDGRDHDDDHNGHDHDDEPPFVMLHGQRATLQDLLALTLNQHPTHSPTWTAVAQVCVEQEIDSLLVSGSQRCSVTDIILGAIGLDKENWVAWSLLADTMDAEDCVEINGVEHTRNDVLITVATHTEDAATAAACWVQLAEAAAASDDGTVSVHGDELSAHACVTLAEGKRSDLPQLWIVIAELLRESLIPGDSFTSASGRPYTALQAAVHAVELDANGYAAWLLLGRMMLREEADEVNVDGETVSSMDCFVKAVDCAPSEANPWYYLGAALAREGMASVDISGETVTRRECWLCCVARDPEFAAAWNNLGTDMDADEVADIHSTEITKAACFVRALEINHDDANAWCNLGPLVEAAPEGTITVGELGTVTAQDCYVKSLECNDVPSTTAADAWRRLGDLLGGMPSSSSPQPTVLVKSVNRSRVDCYLESLNELESPVVLLALSSILSADDMVVLGDGRVLSREDCIAAAKTATPDTDEP